MSFRFPWRTARLISREVDEELTFHLEARTSQLVAAGHPPKEARRIAAQEFGDFDGTRQYCRDADLARERERRRKDYVGDLLLDVRYALRSLRRRPGVTAVVVGSLALAVGMNTAMFSVANAVLLRPLPYPRPAELVQLFESNEVRAAMNFAGPNFQNLVERSRSLAAAGAYVSGPVQVSTRGTATVANLATISAGFMPALAVPPALGRGFTPADTEEGAPAVALVSHGLWQGFLGGDPDRVGQSVTVNGESIVVIGVMPRGFAYPRTAELWVPRPLSALTGSSRTSHNFQVVARIAPDHTLPEAQAELAALGGAIAQEYAEELTPGFRFVAVPLAEQLARPSRESLVILLVIVSLVLMIGCANLAFVLLAQASAREREMAIRQAVGGGTARLTRQLLTESGTLGLLGGVGGLVLTIASLGLLNRIVPPEVLHSGPVRLDVTMVAYALGLGLLAGLVFGLAPVWRATRIPPSQAMQGDGPLLSSGTRRRPFGGTLLVLQFGLSFAALVIAVVMTRSLIRLQSVDEGFATEGRVAGQLLIPVHEGTRYPDYRSAMGFLDRFGDRLRTTPGVVAVGFDRTPPLAGTGFNQRIQTEAGPVLGDDWPDARTVSPGYFEAIGIPLFQGREFVRGDSIGAERVAIINQSLAERLWPGEPALGRVFKRWDTDPWITVVGVVGEVRTRLDREPSLAIYLPMYQDQFRTSAMSAIVHGQGDAEGIARLVADALRQEDPELALRDLRTLEAIRQESIALPRFRTLVVMVFSGLALLLVVLGVYGVMAYAASLRKQELAIRSALGARRRHLTGLFLGQGARVSLLGTVLGVVLAVVLSRLLSSLVFGVDALDPVVMLGIAPVLVGSVLLACLLPARRAARADPAAAMRGDAGR